MPASTIFKNFIAGQEAAARNDERDQLKLLREQKLAVQQQESLRQKQLEDTRSQVSQEGFGGDAAKKLASLDPGSLIKMKAALKTDDPGLEAIFEDAAVLQTLPPEQVLPFLQNRLEAGAAGGRNMFLTNSLAQLAQNDPEAAKREAATFLQIPGQLAAAKQAPGVTDKQKFAQIASEIKQEKNIFDKASKIRGEVAKAGSEFEKIQSSFDRIGAADKSAAGDLALIFNFMKMLDPGSVVRESEFATAENAAGVPDRIRNSFNKVLSGEKLGEAQRADFLKQAGNIFGKSKIRQQKRLDNFVTLGKRFGLEEGDVIVNPLDDAGGLSDDDAADLARLEAKFGGQ